MGPANRMFSKVATAGLALLLAMLAPREAASAPQEGEDIIGETGYYVTRYEDTIPQLARRFDLGFVELMAANPGVDPWLPGAGRQLLLPLRRILPDVPRKGIVINLAELRLYYFRRDGSVVTHPVGIGRDYWQTPEIRSTISLKRKDPTWTPPASIRAERPNLPAQIGPGPDNPLGDYAMNINYGAYVIHGTNKPLGVGRRVSHGCIRLYPEDIEALFAEVPTGTPVHIIDHEIKLGWSGGALYLEAHPGQKQADAIEAGETPDYHVDIPGLMIRLLEIPGASDLQLDWPLIEATLQERRGVPVRISLAPVGGDVMPLPPLD